MKTFGTREIVRNPSILRIEKESYIKIEDKKQKKFLGLYIGEKLADEFLDYLKKKKIVESAKKIKQNSLNEYLLLEDAIDDGI